MSGSARLLIRYDNACRALAEARSVDEVKDVRDKAIAMAAYARQARNRDLEADAIEIRLRATRRLDQLRQAQKTTVGLNEGGRPRKTGVSDTPVVPTLASQGIDKNLAKQGRVLGALSNTISLTSVSPLPPHRGVDHAVAAGERRRAAVVECASLMFGR